jgi:hypothetical protein
LAEFEADKGFKLKIKKLEETFINYNENNLASINHYLDEINYILIPKKLLNLHDTSLNNIFVNKKTLDKYDIEEYNIFIDCPIELHLISVLWIMEIGHLLDEKLEEEIHGFRLVRNSDKNVEEDSFKMFEKYHEKYMLFRDGALQKAIELHKQELDTTIINLDVKAFFYNIKFDFVLICKDYSTNDDSIKLNKIMNLIHKNYQNKLITDEIKSKQEAETIIPIGLLSSSIVSNYVLKDFDNDIIKKVKPAFYSRYVDDMLIVLTNIHLEKEDIVKKIFKSCIFKDISFNFEKDNDSNNELISFNVKNNKFIFQNDKVKIFHFFKTDSIHLLDKFSKTITKNSSLFKLLPEDKDIFNTLEEASYNINYSSTINKISSINGNSLDILNISRNIVQMTKIVMNTNFSSEEIEQYNEQLNNIFVGRNILELQRIWEKVFTYLFVSNSQKIFIKFSKRIINLILNIKYSANDKIETKLINNIAEYFVNSISMAISLYPNDFENNFLKKLEYINTKSKDSQIFENISLQYIIPRAEYLRKSNLIRHYMISTIPLVNYCKTRKSISFYSNKISIDDFNFNIDDDILEFSPRFIHYHEISIFYHLKYLHSKMKNREQKEYLENQEAFIFDKYNLFNKSPQNKEKYPKKDINDKLNQDNYYHNISNKEKSNKLNIALVNAKVYIDNSINSFLGKSNLSFHRLLDIFEVLNTAKKTNCDMIVFPEIYIPFNWLKLIAEFSKLNDIAIIFGMEHFTINRYVFNFSVAILPFQVNKYTNSFIHFNLKSHYSPSEIQIIEGNNYIVPDKDKDTILIDIYKWKDTVFSIFNCYELTNIKSRSRLVGENDFTVTIEYNSDTNYFSNIIGSISRDNHAYIIQVNNSQYGDSRITQPTISEIMDIIKIKGGKDTSLITGEINIKKLREFQNKTHNLQSIEQAKNKYNSYKLTPPSFKVSGFRE